MADELPEKHHKKRAHNFKLACSKTIEEVGIGELIMDAVIAMMAIATAWVLGVAQNNDLPLLFVLEIAAAVLGIVFGFLFRLFFITPWKMIKESDQESEEKDLEIKKLSDEIQGKNSFKPFDIAMISFRTRLSVGADATDQCLAANDNLSDCCIEIHNSNQPIDGIGVTILGIDPPMASLSTGEKMRRRLAPNEIEPIPSKTTGFYSTVNVDLTSLIFQFSNVSNDTLKRDQKGNIRIFTAKRMGGETTLKFDCKEWKSVVPNKFTVVGDYILRIEIFCNGPGTKQFQFRLSFPAVTEQRLKYDEPVFMAEKIESGLEPKIPI